ncbi:hypothetical protein [Saccharothrix sp. NRRL B-16314]|uniref:hypothetical protein n=1 Tax=Saccharothrix sp. NRRL B-16314 TaxID=1463825 RepID=UPI002F360023
MTEKPRVFATLTAPSFGPVHNRRATNRGKVLPCACGTWHYLDDPATCDRPTPVGCGTASSPRSSGS